MDLGAMRRAWRLWRSDESTETVLALGLVLVTVGPYLIRFYRDTYGNRGGGSSVDGPEVV